MAKPFKMRGTPFQRNFGIGKTNAPDATSPLSDTSTDVGTNWKNVVGNIKTKLEGATGNLADFFKASGIQIGKNVQMLGGGSGKDFVYEAYPGENEEKNPDKLTAEEWKNKQKQAETKHAADKKTASQRGWGQVIAKGLAAGMRTLPGGYDAYNPPGDTDVTKYMEGLDDKQRMALLQNILGEDFDLEKLKNPNTNA